MSRHQQSGGPTLPALEPGLTLLEVDDEVREAIHAVVLDQVLGDGATAFWVDARGHATTRPLCRLAPDERVLERVRVARGFTAFQHYALLEALGTQELDRAAVVVAPALDACYRADDLRRGEGEEFLVKGLARLAGLARRRDLPVLITRTRADPFSQPVANVAHRTIACEATSQGPRFVGPTTETLVYPAAHGTVQTTLAFWQRVLAARAPRDEPVAGQVGPEVRG